MSVAGQPVRIAMWSGPRNISTAMMRSFGSRRDTVVVDEPFYACYLTRTGLAHPGADDVMRHHETDPRAVVESLFAPLPDGKSVHYQKHMAHHMLPGIDRDWIGRVRNCFLVRDPREMLLSLSKKIPRPTLGDTGLPQQVELYEEVVERTGESPPVVDSRDVLTRPEPMLARLCAALGLGFDRAMLRWPPGRRTTDGVWARYWYQEVERSTGFAPHRSRDEALPDALHEVLARCVELHARLAAHRLACPEPSA